MSQCPVGARPAAELLFAFVRKTQATACRHGPWVPRLSLGLAGGRAGVGESLRKMVGIRIAAAGCSRKGPVRGKNQDRFLLTGLPIQDGPVGATWFLEGSDLTGRGFMAAVADGIGSIEGGEVASDELVHALADAFEGSEAIRRTASAGTDAEHVQALDELVGEASEAFERRLRERKLSPAGTTLIALWVAPDGRIATVQAGDSRLLVSRDGVCRALTVDHTWAGILISQGKVAPGGGCLDGEDFAMSRYFCGHGSRWETVGREAARPGNRFLLCSDGLHGILGGLPEREVARRLVGQGDLRDLVSDLVEAAHDHDPRDNATAVVVEILAFDDNLVGHQQVPV
ncbi:MAG: serine/threonine-protein phosphatase [Fimbriimonadaceae bacterium]|nr:serine/threonine-protein phosphatase [Fimbriimonadaceae bacterium]